MADDTERPERRNVLLRMLIDEMLDQVRELQRNAAGPWDPAERERAEATLERVMDQVRAEALRRAVE